MNKNAYEIRLEVLSMAHSTVWSQFHDKINSLRMNADRTNQLFDEKLIDKLAPSAKDVLSYAAELYEFVESK